MRAFIALDWLIRTWIPKWSCFIPDAGERLAEALQSLPPVCDLRSARAAGELIQSMVRIPDGAARTIAEYEDESSSWYENAAARAARGASLGACEESAGYALADSVLVDTVEAFMAAKVDVAFGGVSAIALVHSLDEVVPHIQQWASGPGDFDAKKISIGNLAPLVAKRSLEPTIRQLSESAAQLYARIIAA